MQTETEIFHKQTGGSSYTDSQEQSLQQGEQNVSASSAFCGMSVAAPSRPEAPPPVGLGPKAIWGQVRRLTDRQPRRASPLDTGPRPSTPALLGAGAVPGVGQADRGDEQCREVHSSELKKKREKLSRMQKNSVQPTLLLPEVRNRRAGGALAYRRARLTYLLPTHGQLGCLAAHTA